MMMMKLVSTFSVGGMTCTSCSARVQRLVAALDGVDSVDVNVVSGRMEVGWQSNGFAVEMEREKGKEDDDEVKENLLEKRKEVEEAIVVAVENGGFTCTPVPTDSTEANVVTTLLAIEGMTCASCVGRIETVLSALRGVSNASVSLLPSGRARVTHDRSFTSVRHLVDAVEKAGFRAVESADGNAGAHSSSQALKEEHAWRLRFIVALVLAMPVFVITMILRKEMNVVLLILTTPIQFGAGWKFHVAAAKAMRHGAPNMDVLVVLGTNAAYWYSLVMTFVADDQPVFFETSALLITFIALGKYLEHMAKRRTSDALGLLQAQQPDNATLLELDEMTGNIVSEVLVPTAHVVVGDLVRVAPGEAVPLDGTVLRGSSDVDASMVTGESMPVPVEAGDAVIGGTVNKTSMLIIKVDRVGSDTVLSQIVHLIETAQMSKAPIEATADKVSRMFVPIILAISALSFVVWMSLAATDSLPDDYVDEDESPALFSLTFAISVLVIACPCALGLATPAAVMVATGVGARMGLLIKGGNALQLAHSASAVLFDKTGTLTEGKPSVTSIINCTGITMDVDELRKSLPPLRAAAGESVQDCRDAAMIMLEHAASAEVGSAHPIAVAVKDLARELDLQLHEPTDFEVVDGRGVRCRVKEMLVGVGNRAFVNDLVADVTVDVDAAVWAAADSAADRGQTVIFVVVDGQFGGGIVVGDPIKADAAATVAALHEAGIKVVMVTGDNARTAAAVASTVGISSVKAELLPQDKNKIVTQFREEGETVIFVGDGINDAPALTAADIGLAIGSGTDVAVEAADIVLLTNSLAAVIRAIDLSRTTFRRIKFNLFWAFAFNTAGIPFAAGVFFPLLKVALPPFLAGGAMAMSSVLVLVSSLHLRRYQPPL